MITKTLLTLLKFGFAGAVICAAGFAVLTLAPENDRFMEFEVKESKADIWSILPVARTSTQKFTAALESLGHEPPQLFDYNGSTVFFSPRNTELGPHDLLVEYQNTFVEYGLNEKPHTDFMIDAYKDKKIWEEKHDDLQNRNLAMLSGQIVPIYVDDKYLNMGGAVLAGEPETAAEAKKYLEKTGFAEADWRREFSAFRQIEAFRGPKDKRTMVTAVWAEPGLDMRKHIQYEGDDVLQGASPDFDMPACPGCKRSTRFASMGAAPGKDYVTNIYNSPQHFQSVESFYRKSLANRGWKETEASSLTTRALQYTKMAHDREKMLQFARGDEFMTLHIYPTERGTMVTSTKTD